MAVEAGKTIITETPGKEKDGLGGALATAFKAACATAAVILLFLAAYAGYEAALRNGFFGVSEVKITGAQILPERDILQIIGSVEGKNLLALDIREIGVKLSSEPWIETVEIRRQFPGSLVVAVKERTPLFKAALGGASWLVDGHGVLVAPAAGVEESAVPSLWGVAVEKGEVMPGARVDAREVKDAQEAVTGLAGYRLLGKYPIAGADVSQPGVVRITFKNSDTSLTVPRGRWSDEAERLFTVDHILRKEGGAEPASISVAFPGRVIVAYPDKTVPREWRKAGNG